MANPNHHPSFTVVEIRRTMARLSDLGVDYDRVAAPLAVTMLGKRPSAMDQATRDSFLSVLAELQQTARGRLLMLRRTRHERSVPEHEMARRADRTTRMDAARAALEAA